jgi:hypothetical protein
VRNRQAYFGGLLSKPGATMFINPAPIELKRFNAEQFLDEWQGITLKPQKP